MKTEQERKTARAIMEALLEVDVDAYQRTVTDAEDTICRVLQQVKNCDLADVVGRSKQLKAFCQYCESRQIKPKRFNWDEIIKDFESL